MNIQFDKHIGDKLSGWVRDFDIGYDIFDGKAIALETVQSVLSELEQYQQQLLKNTVNYAHKDFLTDLAELNLLIKLFRRKI